MAEKARLLASIEELIGRTKRISALLSPNRLDLFGPVVPESLLHVDRNVIKESNAALSRLQKGLDRADAKGRNDDPLRIGPPADGDWGIDRPASSPALQR